MGTRGLSCGGGGEARLLLLLLRAVSPLGREGRWLLGLIGRLV